jgi:eukaryotic-like serine/threonine-protein kinase
MNVTEVLVLSTDVLIIRVADLPQPVRDEIGDENGFAVTRARGRAASVLVDEVTAQLLGEFREPSTIVDAVIRFSRRLDVDPEILLNDSYPTLRQFLIGGHLVGVNSQQARPHQLAFAIGEEVAGGVVVRCIRVLDDTELYQLLLHRGGLAALKVLRPERAAFAHHALRREAEVLSLIDGRVSPRLLGQGESNGNPWLCIDWWEGAPIATTAAALRRTGESDAELLHLCIRVVEAYDILHELGVVHGDVHPGNVLTSPAGDVCLVDFGLARRIPNVSGDEPPRGGVAAFFDPQYAAALLTQSTPPLASFQSDQYSLGAILYHLITGSHYLDFSIDKDQMLRQIIEDRPLPFTRRGRPPWPELEAVLALALAKVPGLRSASTTELRQQLVAAAPPRPSHSSPPVRKVAALELVLDKVVARARPGGDWFSQGLPPPSCSVAYGAAGLAVALCRVGVLRSDPELVSLADEWVVRAAREANNPGAFTSDELQLDESRTGLTSPFHRLSGVHAVQALVSHALGDTLARQQALDLFVNESRQPCDNLDLTLGRSGTLLAAAILLETIGGASYTDSSRIFDLGNQTLASIWLKLGDMPPIAEGGPMRHLGVAHGWAGLLLATLRWCRIARAEMPGGLESRLEELAALAQPKGAGACWPWIYQPQSASPSATVPGWCNGSEGFVHLWTTAHSVLSDDRWEALAERAAWDTYTSPTKIDQLCCGLTGQAYALLEMYRFSGTPRWLTAASELGTRAAASLSEASTRGLTSGSLHKGEVGIAVLAADLADPEAAAMPFFGAET